MTFRLAAVVLGLTPLFAAELALRAFDLGKPRYEGDPFVGFSAVHPLFELSADGAEYRTAPARLVFFSPEAFPSKKPPGELRIFCLGGSTVYGEPFAKETAFPRWLELSLREADSGKKWRVVNCGGISYASYRLVPILEEILENYQPDLIVIYTGHNEFLEDRAYGHLRGLAPYLSRPMAWLEQTRLYNVLVDASRRLRGGTNHDGADRADAADKAADRRPVLSDETDAMLEYRGGLARYHRNEQWQRDVVQHYEYNLRRMVQLCRDAGVPLLLMNPVSNLRDCAPFKSENDTRLSPTQLARWRTLVGEAADCRANDLRRATELLEEACKIDSLHAATHYELAKGYDALGRIDEARAAYMQAKENDVCPLRTLEPMNRIVLEVSDETATPLLDVRRMFEDLSEHRLPGTFLLVDHIHPSIRGHQIIAEATVKLLEREGLARPSEGWKARQDSRFREHLASLPDLYFSRGLEKLERLRRWTQGGGDAQPPASWSASPAETPTSEIRPKEPLKAADGN
ncbi:MAG: SGNH/GDSL hydrolase family protein [Planctomycetota bacterium]